MRSQPFLPAVVVSMAAAQEYALYCAPDNMYLGLVAFELKFGGKKVMHDCGRSTMCGNDSPCKGGGYDGAG
jgi:hypothetical protein